MTIKERDKLARKLLAMPPVKWKRYFDRLTMQQRWEATEVLGGLIQQAALMYGYADERYGNGCGDQGHAAAVKDANRRLTGVRKVLGYSYPKATVLSF